LDDLIERWLTLKTIPSSKLTTIQLEEQFYLAQAITAKLDPRLYTEMNDLRAKCLDLLRKSQSVKRGTKYSMMTPPRNLRHPSWTEIELTPDITFTPTEELVGTIIPAKFARALKQMIQLQARILSNIRKEKP
jgi:hypothetical protein